MTRAQAHIVLDVHTLYHPGGFLVFRFVRNEYIVRKVCHMGGMQGSWVELEARNVWKNRLRK